MKLLFISFIIFSMQTIGFSQNLDSMLLLYYPFNGNANDASGNNYHGTVYNATLADDRFGNPNHAYYFNGVNSHIDFPNITALKPPLPVSIAMWVNPLSLNLTHQAYVFNSSFDMDTYTGAMINLYPGQPIVSAGYGGGIPGVTGPHNRRTKFGTTNFQTNTWYFIVCVIRGPLDMDIYVNCQNDGGWYDGTGGPLVYGSGAGTMGRSDLHFTSTVYFHGYLDELRYWNRALTAADIDLLCGLMANAGPDMSICQGESVALGGNPSAFNGTPPFTYNWSPATGLNNPGIANPVASPMVTTTYTLVVEDNFSIIASDQVTVTVYPQEDATILPVSDYCDNNLPDTLLSLNPGGQWWGNGITNSQWGVFSPELAGTGSHVIFYGFPGICGDTASVSINVFPAPVVSLGADTTFCSGDTIYLDAGAGADSYLWSNSETSQIISVSSGGNYTVTVTNSDFCDATDEVQVNVIPWENASILSTGPFCHDVAAVQLNALHTGGVWSGFGIIDQNIGLFSPVQAGIGEHLIHYEVTAPCVGPDSTLVTVIECFDTNEHIFVPTIFSPNDDGENDILFVRGEGIQQLEFIIYNRWGEKIFESNHIDTGWDGTYKGKKCDPAVFAYVITAWMMNGQKIVQSGNVTLVR
jgi:gliding motility-associated-like protein